MKLIQTINLLNLGDDRGSLVAIEANKNIPFDIKRVYYLYAAEVNVSRGFHAHKELRQVAICVSGSCRMLMDDGVSKEEVILDSPDRAIVIDKMQWHEMHDFSNDCVLLVLANDFYNESDYIRNYEDFLKLVN